MSLAEAKSNCIVVNSLPFICFWKDPEFVYMGCNTETLIATKFKTEKDFIGRTDYEMPWREAADRIATQDKLALKGDVQFSSEVLTDAHGGKSTFLIKRGPLFSRRKKIIGVIGTGFNLTKENYKEAAYLIRATGINITDIYSYLSSTNPDFEYQGIKFTKRQAQVISYSLKGLSADEIARQIGVSKRTVESAIEHLKEKLGYKKKSQIVDKAFECGFIDLMFQNIT
jgi:DNA-binding CsgD family transcriptional regulator